MQWTYYKGTLQTESLKLAEEGKADLVSLLNRTKGRDKYLNYTTPVLYAKVIVVGRGKEISPDLHELKGKTVAVVRGYKMEEDMRRDHPEIPLLPLPSTEETMLAVGDGRAEATIITEIEANHYIRVLGLNDIKEISDTFYTLELRMGVRKDDPTLLSILNKTIEALTENERKAIEGRWIASEEEKLLPVGATVILATSGVVIALVWMLLSRRRKRS